MKYRIKYDKFSRTYIPQVRRWIFPIWIDLSGKNHWGEPIEHKTYETAKERIERYKRFSEVYRERRKQAKAKDRFEIYEVEGL